MRSVTGLPPAEVLDSIYDENAFSDDAFQAELEAVHEATEIERDWINHAELKSYEDDEHILTEAAAGRLVRVGRGSGYMAIARLRGWDVSRSDPSHPEHYSPPFLTPHAFEVLEDVASKWRAEMGASRSLAVTSLVRSAPYQRRLATQSRKLTIRAGDSSNLISTHQVGSAFDIDGCGIYEETDAGEVRSINPRNPTFSPRLMAESRLVLDHLLRGYADDINVVEELAGTQQHCFHVAVKPPELR